MILYRLQIYQFYGQTVPSTGIHHQMGSRVYECEVSQLGPKIYGCDTNPFGTWFCCDIDDTCVKWVSRVINMMVFADIFLWDSPLAFRRQSPTFASFSHSTAVLDQDFTPGRYTWWKWASTMLPLEPFRFSGATLFSILLVGNQNHRTQVDLYWKGKYMGNQKNSELAISRVFVDFPSLMCPQSQTVLQP